MYVNISSSPYVTVTLCISISICSYVTVTLYVSISVCSYVTVTWYVNISVPSLLSAAVSANLYHAMFPELFAPLSVRLHNEVNSQKYPIFVILHHLSAYFIHFHSYVTILLICHI